MALQRILKELREIDSHPFDGSAGPIDENNLFHWTAVILGTKNSPYHEGVFFFEITFPDDYPRSPPLVYCVSKIFHSNFKENNLIKLTIIERWNPYLSISRVIYEIFKALTNPELDCSLNDEITEIYSYERQNFNIIARDWTLRYAT